MPERNYHTKEEVMRRAQELVVAGLSFGQLDTSGRLAERNKGDLGQIIEESWFGYTPNSDSDPDFAEAGVELKVSPYKVTSRGVSAKERLVCDIINYVEEAGKTFETSAFWHKCKCICLLSYMWSEGIPKGDMYVDHATLLDGYPYEDLLIIRQDWEIIINKIRAGQAHLITEGDTMYLAACTKGASAQTVREQPFSPIPAKQRAYSLKTTYMTHLLRRFVFGEGEDEHVITDWQQLLTERFDDIILQRFEPYKNLKSTQIAASFGLDPAEVRNIKSLNAMVTRRILGLVGDPTQVAEFQNANISVKTIVYERDFAPEESMSFPPFSFNELISEEWEDSGVYSQMVSSRFLFVVFSRNNRAEIPVFRKAFFWNMPAEDIEELRRVWVNARIAVRHGCGLERLPNGTVRNTLPKASQSRVAHVRPHASQAAYIFSDGTIIGSPERNANPLPDGQWMTTQSFWFNKSYVQSIIAERMV